MTYAVAKKAFENSDSCGDECACWENDSQVILCIADGLGHGPDAETAARAAIKYVADHLEDSIADIFSGCNAAIRDTRGVALGLAVIDKKKKNLTYAGIGNTRAIVCKKKTVRLSGNYGIVGSSFRKLTCETVPLPQDSLVILYTDGIEEMIDPGRFVYGKDPQSLSKRILEEWGKTTDDATVMVYEVAYEEQEPQSGSGGNFMEITAEIRDIITELMNTGVGRAAAALSELLHTEIILSVPFLEILTAEELTFSLLSDEHKEYVNIRQNFCGGLEGKGIVSFPVTKGKTLINILLDDAGDSGENFNVLELEAISEVGNLIINAIGSTIADMIGEEIHCRLPMVSVSRNMINMAEEKPGSVYIVGQTDFSVKENRIEGKILFVFSYKNIETLVKNYL